MKFIRIIMAVFGVCIDCGWQGNFEGNLCGTCYRERTR